MSQTAHCRQTACLLILLAAASLPSFPGAAALQSDPPLVDVYVAGQGGYHTYRIPSVIATPKGTLLAFAEARKAGAADAGDIDLVLKRSHDGGATWSAMQIVGDNGPNTFGNPCPVIDRTTGTIWLLTTQNRGTDRESDIIAGTSAASRTVWVMKSEDDGATWSAPVEITSSVKKADWTWYATGPGVGIQTRSGRLVIPANHAEAGTRVHRSHLFFSDDGGKTWTLGARSDEGTNESQVVELADGRLMLNMRNHPPKPQNFRMIATSSDGGGTLTKALPDSALVEPPAQASLLRLTSATAHDRNRIAFANPASVRRERMTVRLSYDEGTTWPVDRVVHEGPAAYSSLVALRDSSIGLLFERGERSPYETITFARLTVEWLTHGKDSMARKTAHISRLPPVPDPHGFAGAFAGIHNGHLLAAGGANFPDGMPWDGGQKVWHDRIFSLDLKTGGARWRTAGHLPAPNGYGVSLTVPAGILLIGGSDARRHFAEVRLLTMTHGKVSLRTLPSLPSPLAQMAGAIVGRHVHVAGGIDRPDATTALAAHYRLDLDAMHEGWQTLAPLPAAGRILPTAAGGDAFYVLGGCSLTPDAKGRPSRTYLREAWRFADGRWTRSADLPRAAAAAASPAPRVGSHIFIVSGDDGAQVLSAPSRHRGFPRDILRYDSRHDTWGTAGDVAGPAPVTLPSVPWRDGFILFNGEIRPGVRTPGVLLLHPLP